MKYLYVYDDGSSIETDNKITEHDKKLCAYKVVGELETFYYVYLDGRELYNPLSINERNYLKRIWTFDKVRKEVFDLYIRYLGLSHKKDLHNPALLTQAERFL